MKKELGELKKPDTKNQLSDEDLYVLDPDYGVDYNIPSNIGSFPPIVPGSFPNYQTNKIPNPNHIAAYPPAMLYPGLYPYQYTYGALNLPQPGSLPFLPEHQHTNITTTTPSHHLLPNQPSLPQHLGLDSLNIQPLPAAITQSNQQKELPKSTGFGLMANLKLPTTSAINPTFAKTPPVNVVITTSDPLPTENIVTSQPVLSVTIPPQHIKSNFFKPTPEKVDSSVTSNEKLAFTIPDEEKRLNDTNDSFNTSDISPEEHEPNITFKPVIPLPDEVPVNTGEEGESELFCGRAKLFRRVNVDGVKEWKERGVGNLKILKNPQSGKTRILMRRDQVFKICANHFITKEMTLYPTTQNDRAFTWAAQDFSDDEIKTETLCVKFKTVEDAKKFNEVFNAVKQSVKTVEEKKDTKSSLESGISLGGFVFTATPTFSPKEPRPVATITEVKETKASPFSTFIFGKSDTKFTSFKTENLIPSVVPQDNKTKPLIISQDNKQEDDGRSSPVEEFIPTAEFNPVVDLPDLIDVKTGEEDSEILFEERAKLFRFDTSGEVNEWKERGVGTLKVLKDESIRLLMRRDQVHKVCCNHRVLKDMIFKISSNCPKAVVWLAQDFSEGVLKQETFTARFKTEQIANEFLQILQKAKANMDENSSVTKVDAPIVENKKESDKTFNFVQKLPEVGGFGDAFKIKPGHWECQSCMVRNEGIAVKCVACNGPNKDAIQQTVTTTIQSTRPVVSGFGDAFKIKPGSWECKTCMIRNNSGVFKCVACGTDKESGFQKETDIQNIIEKQTPKVSGFGDTFKMKPGCWECQSCMVRNNPDVSKCVACGATKDGGIVEKETTKTIDVPKFTFGVPTNTKLTFDKPTNVIPPLQNAQWSFGFTTPTKPILETKTLSESVKYVPDENSFSSISPTKQEFEFKPRKSNNDSDGSYVEEEEDNIHFKPLIPLPAKIQVVTGEEDDDVLYCHKAKLFRFVDKEWKERGIGDIKILKNKSNGTLRVVMRRERVLKICLNHLLTKQIDYKARDDKTLMFTAADYSEDTLVSQTFCVRFKNAEITNDFKKAVDSALGIENSVQNKDENNDGIEVIFETKVTPEEEQEAIKLGLPPKFMSYKQLPDCECEQCKKDDEYLKDLFPKETNLNKNVISTPKLKDTLEKRVETTTPSSFAWPSTTISSSFNFSFSNTFLPPATTSPKAVDSNKSIFSFDNSQFTSPSNIFSQTPIFGQNSNSSNIFGNKNTNIGSIFDPKTNSTTDSGKTGFLFGQAKIPITKKPEETETSTNTSFTSLTANSKGNETSAIMKNDDVKTGFLFGPNAKPNEQIKSDNVVFKSDPKVSLALLAAGSNGKEKTTSIENGSGKTEFSFGQINKTVDLKETDEPVLKSDVKTGFLFGPSAKPNEQKKSDDVVFKSDPKISFASLAAGSNGKEKTLSTENGGEKNEFSFGQINKSTIELKETDDPVLKSDPKLSFASLAANSKGMETPLFTKKKDETFSFLGAGTPVFGSLTKTTTPNTTKNESDDEHNASSATAEDYDPYYEPIIALPKEITVFTGEENENILFIERAKLYRYDSNLKEWKERGVGNIKVLHHPEKKTYRLLLRREQIHKLVLNQLITANLELQPMATSEKAWIWCGHNNSEDETAFEKLAVRFKNQQLANEFYKVIKEVVNKIKNKPLDIPEVVEDFNTENSNVVSDPLYSETNDDYEYDDDDEEEEDDERSVMFVTDCSLSEFSSDGGWNFVGEGCLEVYYDPDLYAARIVIADDSGCVLSNTLIGTNTEMELIENECIWRAVEWGEGNNHWRKLKAKFENESAAQEFHSNYLEGLNYAQQSGLIDELPIEMEPEDK